MQIHREVKRSLKLVLPALCLAAVGCGANSSRPVDARAAGEWTFRLPETRSPYAGLAIDRGGSNTPAQNALESGAADVAPTQLALAPAAPAKAKRSTARPAYANLQKPVAPQTTAPLAATPQAAPAQEPELLAVNSPAPVADNTSAEAERYSSREAKSQRQRDFRGGDAIVISASALLLILLVVILILLLT